MFGKLPSDPFFEEMDPVEKLWLYEGWIHKLEQDVDLRKSIAILTGGFANPELAQKMIKRENPDHVSTDDEFEQSWKMVQDNIKASSTTKKMSRRKRRKLKKQALTGHDG